MAALLQSPSFLFRPELGTGRAVGGAAVALDAYELASRLSYFMTASMPDAALMAAAADDSLLEEATLRSQAQRLLADPRARSVLSGFFAQWLGLYRLDNLNLDPNAFPEMSDSLRQDLKASVLSYIDKALWSDDSYASLLSGSYGFVNDRLAPLFGVAAPGDDALQYVALDPSQRSGVLTQPGVLSATSHGTGHSPILRGVHLLNQVLCAQLGAPPPGVLEQAETLSVDDSLVCTTRDAVSLKHTAKEGCQGCHAAIDAAGFNFENYDALGRYRTEENGCPVDASGSYPGTDLQGEFADAVALAQQLPQSRVVSHCMVDNLFRFAFGRKASPSDDCELAALADQLHEGGSLQQLVVELVASPSFRSRPKLE